ncbi:hypothetical protein BG015_007123 [Linnemannia schmuckeri]|uniref:Uncharacterized protein n=1 Tax=Linnemannia schmuckeri TaxID=64567 RepID=A0A9P5RYW6_9FUNG|nr:hypothetical protein BG015_007123 [Linnemannia schmuckeri]
MAQDHSTSDPTIRVNTCHNRILFIRFETESRLDAWMALFNEEDLNALRPRSASLLPSTSLVSSFDQIPPHPLSTLTSAWTDDAEMAELRLPSVTMAARGGGEGEKEDILMKSWIYMAITVYEGHPQQQQPPWKDYQPGLGGRNENGDKPYFYNNDNTDGNSFKATGATLMADPRASRQHNSYVTDDIQFLTTIPTWPSSVPPPSSLSAQ